jgi:hypothetical protein
MVVVMFVVASKGIVVSSDAPCHAVAAAGGSLQGVFVGLAIWSGAKEVVVLACLSVRLADLDVHDAFRE